MANSAFQSDAGYLTEGEWTEVMRNCGIMYGWIIDRENNRIIRAPKPGEIQLYGGRFNPCPFLTRFTHSIPASREARS